MNLIKALAIEEVVLTTSGFIAKMELGSFHAQPFGLVNGGAILAFGEIVSGYASNLLSGNKYYAVGQSVSGNHLKAKKAAGLLLARGELLHNGRSSHVWDIRIEDEKGILISHITVTNALIKEKDG